YPNPAQNKITIDVNNLVDVKLFDVIGNQITSTKTNEVDVSNLNDGVYFVQVKTNTATTTQKIIVQH
ncbi:MAG TPA: T9SS type A sorting domain-containing protein, partial [Bacteroidia bacterium]|nr:T9SS type A sorting domain-containing protein [Bacteroidia bacterium]